MLATSQDAALGIAVRRIGHRAVLEIVGEIDFGTAPLLTQEAAAELGDGVRDLWIDLAATAFIDVVGVHALLDIQKLAAQDGCRVAVIAPPGRIRRVFDLTGVATRLALFADRSEAHRFA
jgi:anti-sigma B factor antagonist